MDWLVYNPDARVWFRDVANQALLVALPRLGRDVCVAFACKVGEGEGPFVSREGAEGYCVVEGRGEGVIVLD